MREIVVIQFVSYMESGRSSLTDKNRKMTQVPPKSVTTEKDVMEAILP
jgi:hypothetical protein